MTHARNLRLLTMALASSLGLFFTSGGSAQSVPPALPSGVAPAGAQGAARPAPAQAAQLPDDPALFPADVSGDFANTVEPGKPGEAVVSKELFEIVRAITEPSERALALQTIADAAIFTGQYFVAHRALTEAAESALGLPNSLVRDQRLISIINTSLNLADADLREAKNDVAVGTGDAGAQPPAQVDRARLVRRAIVEWRRAAFLAMQVGSPTYRSEVLYRVIDNQSYGSQTLINEVVNAGDRGPDQAESDATKELRKLGDEILVQSSIEAKRIIRPVWRDRAMVTIATNAAVSKQYDRALEIARLIPQPEVRTDALISIAERQSRAGATERATATYEEAARSVSAIPLDDPRAVLTGVLIDNLISVGRFEDARKSVVLYPDEARKIIALGAVAESQGRRGLAREARTWIEAETPESYRGVLFRRVKDGYIAAIEQNRARSTSGR